MKKILFILLLMPNLASANEEMQFVPALLDVPAFYSMEFSEDTIVEFDSAWGSVVEIDGKCNCDCKAVENYYDLIMPNVGWELYPTDEDEKLYIRDGINLVMMTKDNGYSCKVSFSQTN